MTTTDAAPKPTDVNPRWLRTALIVLVAFRTALYVTILPLVVLSFFSDDHSDKVPWPMTVKLIVAPFMAGAALYLAYRGRLAWAIVALAALNLVEWAAELPKLAAHGLPVSPAVSGFEDFAQFALYPLFALVAIVLALRGRPLALAALFACLPLFILVLEAVGLGVATGLYGR